MASNYSSHLAALSLLSLCFVIFLQSRSSLAIGVNWGTTASHPLPPAQVVQLLKANNIKKLKLFDSDPLVLKSLSGSNIHVTVGIPNSLLHSLNSSIMAAETWVHNNLTRFLSDGPGGVLVEYIAVGDDPFLQSYSEQYQPFVIGAATNIQAALNKANHQDKVKVIVPCSYDAFQSDNGLPTKGHFRADINKTMSQLVTFLSRHESPFFVTISPFLSYYQNKNVSLDFALFKDNARLLNDSHHTYRNSFDVIYDTLVTALSTLGFPTMDIVVSEVGWPTDGASEGNTVNAEAFFNGVIAHLDSKSGTPLRPKQPPLETYILSLLDEDQRSIASGNFQRHWGVFTFDGQVKYQVEFNKKSKPSKLVNAQNVEYLLSKWCVANNNKDLSNATAKALEACSSADCSVLSPGSSCYNLSWPGNISYAFNSYYQQHDQTAESCDFGGLGLITTVDPSIDNCRFFVGLRASISSPCCGYHTFHWIVLSFVIILLCHNAS